MCVHFLIHIILFNIGRNYNCLNSVPNSVFIYILGDTEIRTCNQYLIDDCKTANRVTYCYCNKDRCNDRSRQQITDLLTLTESSQTHHIMGRMGGQIPNPDIDEDDEEDFEDDDEGGDDDGDEDTFAGSGLGSMLTTLNSFNTNGLSRPTSKEEPTTSLPSPTFPSVITELQSPLLTTTSPKNNVHHRNKSHRLVPTTWLCYFIFIPVLIFNLK